jgi:hypothetical protein
MQISSKDDETFWNAMKENHPNASAGIRFQGKYDLYYQTEIQQKNTITLHININNEKASICYHNFIMLCTTY